MSIAVCLGSESGARVASPSLQACLGKNRGNHTYYFFTIKIGADTVSTAKTMLKPYSGTFDDTCLSMEYWYGEIQKLRGFGCNSS